MTVLLDDLLGTLQIMLPLEAQSSLTRKVVPYIAGFKLLSLDRNRSSMVVSLSSKPNVINIVT